MKYPILAVAILCALASCKKGSTAANSNAANASNACGATGTPQDTVVDNGSKYYIVAGCSSNNTSVVELIKTAGPGASSYGAGFVQVSKGSNCYRSSLVNTYLAPSQMPAYSFGIVPAWANDTNAVAVCKISIGPNAYYFRDPKINK